jgi:hypothetical protein
MPAQRVAADSAPTKHSIRVEWFRRDPGGTIFVKPARDSGCAPHYGTEHAADPAATS